MTWILVHEREFTGLQQVHGSWSDSEIEQAAQKVRDTPNTYEGYAELMIHTLKEFLPQPIRDVL